MFVLPIRRRRRGRRHHGRRPHNEGPVVQRSHFFPYRLAIELNKIGHLTCCRVIVAMGSVRLSLLALDGHRILHYHEHAVC